MRKLIERRHLVRQNLVAILGVCLSLYFCYHLVAGERSYLRLLSLERQIDSGAVEVKRLSAEREDLERNVVMLRPGSIDRDFLEERARVVLGYAREGEQVLIASPGADLEP